MLRLHGLGTYTDDQIMAIVRRGKQRRHISDVGRVLARRGRDILVSLEPQCTHTADLQLQHEVGSGSRSSGDGDDEPSNDEDAGEEEEDEDS
nr:hypothetical protein [Tanacetum cinerariifolium]